MKKEDIIAGARIRVKNGKAVHAFLAAIEAKTSHLNPGAGRAPFAANPYADRGMERHWPQDEGEEFEIVLAPGRKKVIFRGFDTSCKWVAIRRVRDNMLMLTYYSSVLYDSVPA